MFFNKQSDLHLILELQQAFEKSCSYLPISALHGIVACVVTGYSFNILDNTKKSRNFVNFLDPVENDKSFKV